MNILLKGIEKNGSVLRLDGVVQGTNVFYSVSTNLSRKNFVVYTEADIFFDKIAVDNGF